MSLTIRTNGRGCWSNVIKDVTITKFELNAWDDQNSSDESFGELRVVFDTKTWNIDTDGLIYTDGGFIFLLCNWFAFQCLPSVCTSDLSYSEQGMQGDDFVSFDVGPEFIKSYRAWAELQPSCSYLHSVKLNEV